LLYFQSDRPRGFLSNWLLRPQGENAALIELGTEDGSSAGRTAAFSPCGRYLGWSSSSGTISVLDMEALRDAMRGFAQGILGEEP
jgi:hypothetical protein